MGALEERVEGMRQSLLISTRRARSDARQWVSDKGYALFTENFSSQ